MKRLRKNNNGFLEVSVDSSSVEALYTKEALQQLKAEAMAEVQFRQRQLEKAEAKLAEAEAFVLEAERLGVKNK